MKARGKSATTARKNSTSKVKLVASTNRAIKKSKKATAPVASKKLTQQSHSVSSGKTRQQNNSKFDSLMTKVNDLIKDGCIRQAYAAIPDETKFPENAAEIKALKTDLMEQIWNL